MTSPLTEIAVLLIVTVLSTSAPANSGTSKPIKVRGVCGIVLDGSGVPIRGATVHIQSAVGKWLVRPVRTQTDGQFSLTEVPGGGSILAVGVTVRQINSVSLVHVLLWPLDVTSVREERNCEEPLIVHLDATVMRSDGD